MPTRRTPLTRRDFIKSAAGAAFALAGGAPMIIPSSALGNANTAAPSERLTLGFIGIGKQSSGHLGALSGKKETQVLAVCDVYKKRLDHAKKTVDDLYKKIERKGSPDAYGDFREVLARKDIDAVVIGTPDHWHTIPIIEACKAKKDIYCEKPLTLTIHEAKKAIEAVRKYDVVFQTGSQQRSEGPFRDVVDYIRNGRLGKIKEVHVGIGETSKPCDLPGMPVPEGLDWETWLGQAPKREWNEILCSAKLPDKYPFNPGWRDYREFSGGHVTDWGAHHFDITQWALSMDKSGPVEIIPPEKAGDVYGVQLIYRGSPAGDEIVVTHKKMDNGIRFIGEKGEIFVDRGKKVSKPDSILKEPLGDDAKRLPVITRHRENWLECIKTRQRPIADVEIGARSVTVCHLANLAYWHGKRLNWDPQKWEFTGDYAAEANNWRDRERREKYQLPEV